MAWILPPEVLENSPSRKDGITFDDETTYRRRTAIFIDEAGALLKYPRTTIATAQVFCHRFYAFQSFKQHRRFCVAVTCLFLAGKVEESFVKLKVAIITCHTIWYRNKKPPPPKLTEDSEEYEQLRLQILKTERILLHTIGFDLWVEHPYTHMIEFIKTLHSHGEVNKEGGEGKKDDKQKREFAQKAVNFLNDSMRTSLCLQFPPRKIAAAAVYIAGMYLQLPISDLTVWMETLPIDDQELKNICEKIMQVYGLQVNENPQMRQLAERLNAKGFLTLPDSRPQKRQRKE